MDRHGQACLSGRQVWLAMTGGNKITGLATISIAAEFRLIFC